MTLYCSDEIAILRMTMDNADEAHSLSCKVFTDSSVIHTAVGVTEAEYRKYTRTSFESMCNQGLSLFAFDHSSNELVGCLISCDYAVQPQNFTPVPAKLKPINALLQNLDLIYRKKRQPEPGLFMLVDMAVVKPEARGKGVYTMLRHTAHKIGHSAGFTHVVGELSSAATQHLCINKLGHNICAEIDYTSFKYGEQTPFATIKEPPSIVLVEGELS